MREACQTGSGTVGKFKGNEENNVVRARGRMSVIDRRGQGTSCGRVRVTGR